MNRLGFGSQTVNIKLLKYVQDEGYCCLWAWFEANRTKLTSVMVKEIGTTCTLRAFQQNRAKYRSKEAKCEGLASCLKDRIKDGHTIHLHPRIKVDTSSGD